MSRTVVVEGWWAEDWHELTASNEAPIRIRTGARDEARSLVPAEASLTIKGSAAEPMNPAHPASALYGEAGRNTPMRIAVRYAATSGPLTDVVDTFTRTVADGWGDPDVGDTWDTSISWGAGTGAASEYSVGSGVGNITVNAAGAGRLRIISTQAVADVDLVVTLTADAATGGARRGGLRIRGQGVEAGLAAYLEFATSGATTLRFEGRDYATKASLLTGITHTGQAIRLRLRAAGTQLAARAWEASGSEPTSWDLLWDDVDEVPVEGWIGCYASREAGNTNSDPMTFDDLAVTCDDPRIAGEASSWRPVRNPGEPYRTQLTISGVLRRYGQPGQPLDSALRRGLVERGDLLAWWPLEDGADATLAGTGVAGGTPVAGGGFTLGEDAGNLRGAASVMKLADGAHAFGRVQGTPDSTEWTLQLWLKLAAAVSSGTNLIARVGESGGSAAEWHISLTSAGPNVDVYDADGASLDAQTSTWGGTIDETEWLLLRLHVRASGGDILWDLSHAQVGSSLIYILGPYTISSATVGRPVWSQLLANTATAGWSVSHWLLGNGDVPVYADQIPLGAAWAGESAGDRLLRLAGESDLVGEVVDSARTPFMGYQAIKTLAALADEIGLTDGGIVSEPRGWPGIRLRPATTMYGQTPALTLDMTDESVAPGLAPVIDDLPTENDVTASRPGGGQVRAVLTSGPMSTAAPAAGGVGTTQGKHSPNLADDGRLAGWAGWRLHLGTCPDARYQLVRTSCERHPELEQTAAAVLEGDVIEVDGLDGDDRRLLVLGCVEELAAAGKLRTLGWVCAPAAPWQVATVDDTTGLATIGHDGSTLASAWDAGTDTTLSVAIAAGRPLWVTGTVDLQVAAGGVVAAVSNIAGSSSPQTFTIAAAPVNGITKTVPAGTTLRLRRPNYIGWEGQ